MIKEIPTILEHLISRQDLDYAVMQNLLKSIINSELPKEQVSAALVLLRAKGESVEEITTAANLLLGLAKPIVSPSYICADIVGTGGDGFNTINISTIASLVVSSLNVPVAKHGNVSVSSKCGSADVLTELGIDIRLNSDDTIRCLDENKWCFLFAPNYHEAFRAVRDVRSALKIKTIFNILGPLLNPIDPKIMLIGVFDKKWVLPLAQVLRNLGKSKALVVHGSGLDEIALHGTTTCALLADQNIECFEISPSDLGLREYLLTDLAGSEAKFNASQLVNILSGQASEAKLSIVAASAGALLWLAERAVDIKSGVQMAKEALINGSALNLLKRLQGFKHGA